LSGLRNKDQASFNVEAGITCRQEYVVEEQHTAKHIGSGTVEVLATPAMILFMENTALNCVQKYLPEGYTTVGTAINVKHLNPAPKGSKVVVEATVESVEGRRIVFRVVAKLGEIIIGEGVHERYVVNIDKFAEKVKSILSKVKP